MPWVYQEVTKVVPVSQPPQGQVGRGEQEQAGPTDKNEAVALEPVVEDVEPSPLWRAP